MFKGSLPENKKNLILPLLYLHAKFHWYLSCVYDSTLLNSVNARWYRRRLNAFVNSRPTLAIVLAIGSFLR